ncbi:MAG: YidC/Oxa1 family membrane protein insertase [Nitrospiraceae bacterium]
MHLVLSATYAATGHYGVALFVLSVCVNLALLPLYHLAEKWQQAQRGAQQRLEPKLREFRQAFSGEERFMMIRTLYRQAGYHPIYALRTSVGFLIQVPFFIAAYHLLSQYHPLQGVSFLIIKDLSQPDALLLGVNLIPFVMTGVNLLSALVYSQTLSTNEKIQLWSISVLFLVLLYGSPAALVIYWTFNNVFSLLKNLAYARINRGQRMEIGQEETTISTVRRLVASASHRLSKHLGTINTPTWFKVSLFLLFLDRMYYYRNPGPSASDASLAIKECIAILAYLSIMSLHGFINSFERIAVNYVKVVLLFCLGVATAAFAADWVLEVHALLEPLNLRLALVACLLLIILVATIRLNSALTAPQHAVLVVSSVLLAAIVLFFNPLFVYTSSTERIGLITSGDIQGFLLRTLCAALLIYSLCFVISGYFKESIPTLYVTGIGWLGLLAFTYGYVVTVNYGVFRGDKFSEEGLLFTYAQMAAVPELLILPLVFYVIYRMVRSNPMVITIFFSIVIGFLSKDLMTRLYDRDADLVYARTDPASAKPGTTNSVALSPNDDLSELGRLKFSKTRANIVLLIPDAAAGYVFSEVFREHPSLWRDLDGFTFFPNAISSAGYTLESTAALIAGPKYTPSEVNKNPGPTIEQLIIKAYTWLIDQLRTKQYDVTVMNPSYLRCTRLDLRDKVECRDLENTKQRKVLYDKYAHLAHDTYLVQDDFIYVFSLFKSLPLSLKPVLYRSRYWAEAFLHPEGVVRSYIHYLYLKSLPQLSYADQNNGSSQFIHLWTQDVHPPFVLDEDCRPSHFRTFDPYGKREMKIASLCYLRAVSGWFQWMKREGVYDNTKIIIASDHGAEDYSPAWHTGAVNPLMMVKDFGARGRLKSSDRLVYNADVISLICSAVGGCQGIGPDPTRQTVDNRSLTYSVTKFTDIEFGRTSNKFEIERNYVLTQNVVNNPRWRESVK